MSGTISIELFEQPLQVEKGITLMSLRNQTKPDADVVIRNGAPATDDIVLEEGDAIVFIKRGEMPAPEVLDALLAARHTPGVHQKIRHAAVGIAGLGGLGSSIALALARIGIGRLVLADFDVVEPSNINRQQYFLDQIGMLKTEALAATLRRVHPNVALECHPVRLNSNNIPGIFKAVHVLAEAFDRAGEKAMLVETALRCLPGMPIVAASGLAGVGSANTIQTQRIRNNFYLCGDGVSEAKPGQGLMAPRVGVAAHHQATAIVRLLLGETP